MKRFNPNELLRRAAHQLPTGGQVSGSPVLQLAHLEKYFQTPADRADFLSVAAITTQEYWQAYTALIHQPDAEALDTLTHEISSTLQVLGFGAVVRRFQREVSTLKTGDVAAFIASAQETQQLLRSLFEQLDKQQHG